MTATLQLFDSDIPPTGGGDYVITLTQTADDIATVVPPVTQPITFTSPQVSLDTAEVVQCTPPPSSTGPFAEILPSVLLAEPSLPWERTMPASGSPWLALVIFQSGELSGGDPATSASTSTVGQFQAITDSVVPAITLETDVSADQPCTYIRIPAATFTATMPRADELPWLTHVRRSTAEDGTSIDRGVVIANRFPMAPARGTTQPTPAVAHLVSVEGLTPWLVDDPVFTATGKSDGTRVFDSVVVLSLARWTFGVVPDPAESFQGLTLALQDAEYDAKTQDHTPGNLALRLPLPAGFGTNKGDPGQVEVVTRIKNGYAPLTYHARSGEEAMAWYRGPVTPELVAALDPPIPFPTADAALIYDEAHGVFDVSLASAWQIGRTAALADRAFGQSLYSYRQAQQRLGDTLVDRARRPQFSGPPSARPGQVVVQALGAVHGVLRTSVGAEASPGDSGPERPVRGQNVAAVGTALLESLGDPQVTGILTDLLSDDLAPVADWLAGLSLLTPVPFSCLVPDPRMLPRETPSAVDPEARLTGAIRFGYVDPNWTTALLSGALSLAVESSRQAGTPGTIDPAVLSAVSEAIARRCGLTTPPAGPMSALLLRSDLVSGWPTLAVTPLDSQGTAIPVLREDRLAPGVLLAIFDGVPASVRIAEPHVALTLGVDEQGGIELRNLVPPPTDGAPPVGAPLGVTAPILTTPTCVRGTSRVLSVVAAGGLVPTLTAALTNHGQAPTAFGPAALGLQLARAPQAMTFDSSQGS